MSDRDKSGSDGSGDRQSGEISPEEREAFRKRASELGKRLDEAQSRHSGVSKRSDGTSEQPSGAGLAQAFRFATELIVGLGVGWFIGNALDGVFGTGPWLLILFIMVGFAAGMLNVIRAATRSQRKGPAAPPGRPELYDDEDDK